MWDHQTNSLINFGGQLNQKHGARVKNDILVPGGQNLKLTLFFIAYSKCSHWEGNFDAQHAMGWPYCTLTYSICHFLAPFWPWQLGLWSKGPEKGLKLTASWRQLVLCVACHGWILTYTITHCGHILGTFLALSCTFWNFLAMVRGLMGIYRTRGPNHTQQNRNAPKPTCSIPYRSKTPFLAHLTNFEKLVGESGNILYVF